MGEENASLNETIGDDVVNGTSGDLDLGNLSAANGSFDLDNYIATFLGPRRLDVSVPMTILYCFLWFFGMAGEQKTILFFSALENRDRYRSNGRFVGLTKEASN